jgi:hypothetical protein
MPRLEKTLYRFRNGYWSELTVKDRFLGHPCDFCIWFGGCTKCNLRLGELFGPQIYASWRTSLCSLVAFLLLAAQLLFRHSTCCVTLIIPLKMCLSSVKYFR